ncbi:MAG: pentapeptide repeat-containing protein, partial [Candidatus Poseidoniaceae archaeon]
MSNKPFEPMKTKFSPTSNASNRKRAYTAIGLAMLLTFVSVMVYMISSLDEDAILSQDEVDVELNEWHTYYVESESDLPECADDTIGRLYYIESSEKFEACTSNGWITVDIKGADGAPGQDGSDGAPGLDGQDGVAGQDGQDVDPAQLQEIQDDILELNNATACQLVPYGNCAGADLSHMNLSGMDLTGINLRGANLENTSFENSTLS